MIVCPQCRKEAGAKDYMGWQHIYRPISQITCPDCGYFGLPLKMEKRSVKGGKKVANGKPKARNKGKVRNRKRKK